MMVSFKKMFGMKNVAREIFAMFLKHNHHYNIWKKWESIMLQA